MITIYSENFSDINTSKDYEIQSQNITRDAFTAVKISIKWHLTLS